MSGKLFLAGYFNDVVTELGFDRADNLADFFGKSDLHQTPKNSPDVNTLAGYKFIF